MLCSFLPCINRNQPQVYTCRFPLELPPTSHTIPLLQIVSEHHAELPVLHSNFSLAIYFTNPCMYAKLLQSCLTLCDFTNCSPPGSSVHGILQARIMEWVAMPSSRDAIIQYMFNFIRHYQTFTIFISCTQVMRAPFYSTSSPMFHIVSLSGFRHNWFLWVSHCGFQNFYFNQIETTKITISRC